MAIVEGTGGRHAGAGERHAGARGQGDAGARGRLAGARGRLAGARGRLAGADRQGDAGARGQGDAGASGQGDAGASGEGRASSCGRPGFSGGEMAVSRSWAVAGGAGRRGTRRLAGAVVGLMALVAAANAGDRLLLKSRVLETGGLIGGIEMPDAGQRLKAGVKRVILQYRERPGEAELARLRDIGGTVLGELPEDGWVVVVPEDVQLEALPGLVFVGGLAAGDKVSRLIGWRTGLLVVEFFPDLSGEEASRILAIEGMAEQRAEGLLPHQKLIRGDRDEAEKLARWNETAYVYPADPALAGEAVRACGQSAGGAGRTGQYVGELGASWNVEPGEEASTLGWHVAEKPPVEKLAGIDMEAALVRALSEWGRFGRIEFHRAGSPGEARTVNVKIEGGNHGDDWPFDGPGRVLAHAFYPSPSYAESIAGDIHLDLDEAWTEQDIYSVLLHEAGHALGLVHSDDPASVMYPMYRRVRGLGVWDIAAVRKLYGTRMALEEEESSGKELVVEIAEVHRNTAEFPPGELVALAGRAWGGSGQLTVRWRYGSGGGWIPAVGAFDWIAPVVPMFGNSEEILVEVRDGVTGNVARTSTWIERTIQ